jgi:riboflavin kinase/FMN adenylyltransferase
MIRVLSIKGNDPTVGAAGRAVAVGNFDGVHLGHRVVIERVIARARERGLSPALVSFYPHPSVALGRASVATYLTPLREKVRLLSELGLEELILIQFTCSVRELSPASFLKDILIDRLNVKSLILGYDTRLGKDRAGDAATILPLFSALGKDAEVADRLESGGQIISSRGIRGLIQDGNVPGANELLGRRYTVTARVVHGDGRGAALNFPTANLLVRRQLLPQNGVYAGYAHHERFGVFRAVANIGVRPTFGTGLAVTPRLEVHLLDFSGRLYGERLSFSFVLRLREERKFDSVDDLRKQIENDCADAKALPSPAEL